jgi:hypothetical protein
MHHRGQTASDSLIQTVLRAPYGTIFSRPLRGLRARSMVRFPIGARRRTRRLKRQS